MPVIAFFFLKKTYISDSYFFLVQTDKGQVLSQTRILEFISGEERKKK